MKSVMEEYFKCKRCYTDVSIKGIAQHYSDVHSEVPHDFYLDNFFDLNRPLFECQSCSGKMTGKRLNKHMKRAHPTKTESNLADSALVPNVDLKRDQTADVIDLSSDSEFECSVMKRKKILVDKAVQCESFKIKMVDKCIGEHCKMKNVAVNTDKATKTTAVGTQTSQERTEKINPVRDRVASNLTLEFDDEDGWIGLVFG